MAAGLEGWLPQPAAAAIEQAEQRVLLIPGAPAPRAAGLQAQDVGRLEPGPGAGQAQVPALTRACERGTLALVAREC
jgi:hypothetical protein